MKNISEFIPNLKWVKNLDSFNFKMILILADVSHRLHQKLDSHLEVFLWNYLKVDDADHCINLISSNKSILSINFKISFIRILLTQ